MPLPARDETPAMRAACAAFEAKVAETVDSLIEARAGKFAQRPILLDVLDPGLSARSPRKMHNRILALIDDELTWPRRHIGFGGEIPILNLNATELYARRLIAIDAAS